MRKESWDFGRHGAGREKPDFCRGQGADLSLPDLLCINPAD